MYAITKLQKKKNFIVNFNGSTSTILSNNRSYFFFFDILPYLYIYYWENDYDLEV